MASSTTSKSNLSLDITAMNDDPEKVDPTTEMTDEVDAVNDPHEVSWDSPNDTANPLNWSKKKKIFNIFILSAMTFLTPLASSMFAPVVPDVMREFNSDRWDICRDFVMAKSLMNVSQRSPGYIRSFRLHPWVGVWAIGTPSKTISNPTADSP